MALEAQAYRGQRLGLPHEGPGSIADFAPRLGAFVVDCVASGLVAAAGVSAVHHGGDAASRLPGNWSLIPFALDYLVGLTLAGRTLGMYLFGVRVIRVDRPVAINLLQAFERTVLLALVIPAVIWDRDRRGFHDRLTRTAVVRA
jgi:uncharacterized RDD family membrane protein YckC